ncbi:MAG: iron-containing alcohol dehydrogenase family protein [Gloeomargaritaceae cyanobacterium C42_A2020_066]|nr:iron-containing alcohol dehydrogenase family protein [Gloeomargaritaceae cyanobacterium C42_A2020_066]
MMPLPQAIAPSQVLRGRQLLADLWPLIEHLGRRPLVVGGTRALALLRSQAAATLPTHTLWLDLGGEASEAALAKLLAAATVHKSDVILGCGGGKALDMAKLLAHRIGRPVVTIPTSGATCAAWTALSNLYSDQGAFLYDVALPRCPDGIVLDYTLIETAPRRTLVAGIGDALAKWYEASISSRDSQEAVVIMAVQQARVLRDLLFQWSAQALNHPGGHLWQQVVDATVLLPGLMGGLGGAPCRTVAAHAVHNGLTHIPATHGSLHGEKVALGVLVQLRLEETLGSNPLAAQARQQLLGFYRQVDLPTSLAEIGLPNPSPETLAHIAQVATAPGSDVHRLPFPVTAADLVAALVTTDAGQVSAVEAVSPASSSA